MYAGEEVDEEGWVGLLQAVPQGLQDGEQQVQAVAQVEGDQQVVEAVPGLPPGEHGHGHQVADDAEEAGGQGGGQGQVGEAGEVEEAVALVGRVGR